MSAPSKKNLSHPGPAPLSGVHGGRWRSAQLPAGARTPTVLVRAADGQGRPRGALAWLPTLQAKGRHALAPSHLRWRQPPATPSTLHMLLLDTSGSMRHSGRLALAKGYAAQVLEQAARVGEQVALLCFGGQGVEVLVAPGPARRAAAVRVQQRGGGGGTPLAHALAIAENLVDKHHRRTGQGGALPASASTVFWLLTDGRTREQPTRPRQRHPWIVVDFDDPVRPVGRCAEWAARWGAHYRRPG